MFLGPFLFLLFFAFLSATVREKTANIIGTVMHWITLYQPLSYVVVMIVIAAPLISFLLVANWPRTPDPENPLLQYRRENMDSD